MSKTDRPIWRDIAHDLRDKIKTGADGYAPGDRLPGLKELARIYFTSTQPVRTALELLAHHGLIDIRHGNGTYVAAAPAKTLTGLTDPAVP